jgi:Restriction endonuclease
MNFDSAAAEHQRRELARLSDTVTPRLETFRSLTRDSFTAEIALMMERLGYYVIATAPELVATKDGQKYVVACATPANPAPTQTRELARLHAAVVSAKAHIGFYVTPHGFTREAEHYAASAPIKLVPGRAGSRRRRALRRLPQLPEPKAQVAFDVNQYPRPPGQAHCINQPAVAGTATIGDLEPVRDLPLKGSWKSATAIKVNPDSPQRPLRAEALRRGITVFVPTPRLRGGFKKLDPRRIPPDKIEAAASLSRGDRWSEEVALADMPGLDTIVCGSVAVTRAGAQSGDRHRPATA